MTELFLEMETGSDSEITYNALQIPQTLGARKENYVKHNTLPLFLTIRSKNSKNCTIAI